MSSRFSLSSGAAPAASVPAAAAVPTKVQPSIKLVAPPASAPASAPGPAAAAAAPPAAAIPAAAQPSGPAATAAGGGAGDRGSGGNGAYVPRHLRNQHGHSNGGYGGAAPRGNAGGYPGQAPRGSGGGARGGPKLTLAGAQANRQRRAEQIQQGPSGQRGYSGGYGGRGGYGGPPQGGYEGGNGRYQPPRGNVGGPGYGAPQGAGLGGAGHTPPASQGGVQWPGLDGGPNFDDEIPAAEEAFQQQFGVPKSSGIEFAKYDSIDVKLEDSRADIENASGEKPSHDKLLKALAPRCKTFTDMKLGKVLSRNLKFNNYAVPTPVQQTAVPIAVSGRDIMACAQTGSGKTLAFMLPICWHLLKRGAPPPSDRSVAISALVLAPTRELAIQIEKESEKFSFRSGLRFRIAYGGTHINEQMRAISRGCDVLVATPGRLVDIMQRGVVTLRSVVFLVLDEADRMLDMGFEPQMRMIIESTEMPTGQAGRRTMMFSATFPKSIQRLAQDFLCEPVRITVGVVGGASRTVTQRVFDVQGDQKINALQEILREIPGLTVIFTETKRNADMLEHALIMQKFPATSIHGDRSQEERERALQTFKSGKTPILVATNVAARGLDIENVTHVINFEMPKDIDDYIHRIGRTGRAGHKGTATSFMGEYDLRIAKELVLVLNEAGQEVPKFLKSMAARGPVYSTDGPAFSGRPAKRSDRDIDCAEPEPEVQKIGADLAAFGTAAAAADDDPGFWSD